MVQYPVMWYAGVSERVVWHYVYVFTYIDDARSNTNQTSYYTLSRILMPIFQPILISLCIKFYQLHYCLALHTLSFPLLPIEGIKHSASRQAFWLPLTNVCVSVPNIWLAKLRAVIVTLAPVS
jgi:hypothetical protein